MWLFCLLDPFIPTQIKFLATPLVLIRLYLTGNNLYMAFLWTRHEAYIPAQMSLT